MTKAINEMPLLRAEATINGHSILLGIDSHSQVSLIGADVLAQLAPAAQLRVGNWNLSGIGVARVTETVLLVVQLTDVQTSQQRSVSTTFLVVPTLPVGVTAVVSWQWALDLNIVLQEHGMVQLGGLHVRRADGPPTTNGGHTGPVMLTALMERLEAEMDAKDEGEIALQDMLMALEADSAVMLSVQELRDGPPTGAGAPEWHHEHVADVLGKGLGFTQLEDEGAPDDMAVTGQVTSEEKAEILRLLNKAVDESDLPGTEQERLRAGLMERWTVFKKDLRDTKVKVGVVEVPIIDREATHREPFRPVRATAWQDAIAAKMDLYEKAGLISPVGENEEIKSLVNLVLRMTGQPGEPGSKVRTTTNCKWTNDNCTTDMYPTKQPREAMEYAANATYLTSTDFLTCFSSLSWLRRIGHTSASTIR
jgi:hypothetical protein